MNYNGNRGFSKGLYSILVLFLLAVGGFAWVSMGIVAKDRWPIRWLEINGNFQRVSAEQLRARLTPLIESSFFTIDLHELRDTADGISWVSNAQVQKRWPDTVVVEVEEYVPFAHWNQGQLISGRGEPFSVPEADGIQGLPWLSGPETELELVLEYWSRFSEELAGAGLEIQQLKLDPRGAWLMHLASGTTVKLGRHDPYARLQRLMNSWDALMAGKETPPVVVDLRYTNGFAVSWLQNTEKLAGNNL
jgi:cell division protein FtsQ